MPSQLEEVIWNGGEILFRNNLERVVLESTEGSVTSLHCNFQELLEQAAVKAKIHHVKHVQDTLLKQSSVDIYKVLSWLTWHITDACPDDATKMIVAIAGIDALNYVLSKEPSCVELPDLTVRLLQAFLVNEAKGKPIHGIALNGLFIAFHSANQVLKQTQNS